MPKGPKGEMRPANVIGCAVHVAPYCHRRDSRKTKATVPARAAGGRIGGRKRAKCLSEKRRAEIARAAAEARWGES